MKSMVKRLREVDPEVAEAVRLETERQACGLELIASENFVSKAPENVVNDVRETLEGLKKQLASVEEIIRDLSAG